MSGRCDPPAAGSLVTNTSPGRTTGCAASTPRIDSLIAPRCTGMCGALATSPPAASNTAHEKSSRSRMFVDSAVRCSTTPMCRAIPAIFALMISRLTGSTAPTTTPASSTSRATRHPSAARSATNPASSTIVAVASRISAGPAIRSPATIASRRHTGTDRHAPSIHMSARSGTSGHVPSAIFTATAPPTPRSSTRAATTSTGCPGRA